MPYTVLALKWRPKNFDEVVGQKGVVTSLKNAILKNQLAHAYLFAGPRGVGKTTVARILAKALNCKDGPTVNPCGECPSCREISLSTSLDVIEIDGASNRGIEEIRQLREHVKFAPLGGKFKVYIIDEVHQITNDGFNALLKTLEEPPPFVKFIFATTHPHKIIPTILSRCQRLNFYRIPIKEIVAQLERIALAENISVDKDVLFTVAKASDGSLRDAESILDQLASSAQGKISGADVVNVLGLIGEGEVFKIVEKIIASDGKGALEIFNSLIEQGQEASLILNSLLEHYRNLMVVKFCPKDSNLVELSQESYLELTRQAGHFSLEDIFVSFNILNNALEMTKRIDSQRIPVELALIKLAYGKKQVSAEKSESKISNTHSFQKRDFENMVNDEMGVQKKNNVSFSKSHLDKTESLDISLEKIKDNWVSVLDAVSREKIYLSHYLSEASIHSLDGSVLTLSFPKNCSLHKESMEKKENRSLVERIIKEICGAAVKLSFILSKEQSKSEEAPILNNALKTFNGRIVKEE